MAKKVTGELKLQIPAGKANPSPPETASPINQIKPHNQSDHNKHLSKKK
jgi:ribosomal protein L11